MKTVLLHNTMFEICGKDECDVTIPGFEACGLAIILEDIGKDLQTAYAYCGDSATSSGLFGEKEKDT